MHAVISLLLQSRKFWWYLLLTVLLLHDVIQYLPVYSAHWLSVPRAHSTHATGELVHQETPDFIASNANLWPPNSPGLNPVDYEIGLSCSSVSTRDKSIVWINWNGSSLMSGAVLNSRFLAKLLTSGKEDLEHASCVCAKGGHFEYSLWTDLVHISVTCVNL